MAHYARCEELLRDELGIAPPAEMRALLKIPQPTPTAPPQLFPTPLPDRPRHNLPAPHDQFIGRTEALRDINARLDQPWCRLVTLEGPGGVGKTRLAVTAARDRIDHYADGVWLVELAEVDADDADIGEAIAVEIATALDLRLSGSATPRAQLLDFLQPKELLLVLDNFEHLLAGGVELVLAMVERCAKVQLLVTAREALRTRAEWTIVLTGLAYPMDDADATPSLAVDLFTARCAQQRRKPVAVSEQTAIRRICRLVEGLPLAIELAAALTRQSTMETIAETLGNDLDALTTSLRDVPPRHRSLSVVFEMSWRTLTPALQARLARLAIFSGSFTAAAAQQIADADGEQLAALVAKSLLMHDVAADRYRLHALVRACAADLRPEQRAAADPVEDLHARYYLALLAAQAEALQKSAPQVSIALIHPEMDNVRTAWQRALAQGETDLLYAALPALSIYYQLRGLAHEAQGVMQSTLQHAPSRAGRGALSASAGSLSTGDCNG